MKVGFPSTKVIFSQKLSQNVKFLKKTFVLWATFQNFLFTKSEFRFSWKLSQKCECNRGRGTVWKRQRKDNWGDSGEETERYQKKEREKSSCSQIPRTRDRYYWTALLLFFIHEGWLPLHKSNFFAKTFAKYVISQENFRPLSNVSELCIITKSEFRFSWKLSQKFECNSHDNANQKND
jgi:hypothetical protein